METERRMFLQLASLLHGRGGRGWITKGFQWRDNVHFFSERKVILLKACKILYSALNDQLPYGVDNF